MRAMLLALLLTGCGIASTSDDTKATASSTTKVGTTTTVAGVTTTAPSETTAAPSATTVVANGTTTTDPTTPPPPAGTPAICTADLKDADFKPYADAKCNTLALACNDDADCTAVTGGCQALAPVNKAFAKTYKQYLEFSSRNLDCAEPPEYGSFKTACTKKSCEVTEKLPLETGPADKCLADADCYCRIFDGAQFKPGKQPSTCTQSNVCAQCTYE
jgi:hypothetical protein